MSLDFYFYVEVRGDVGWNRPEAFAPERSNDRCLGEFTWLRGRSPVQDLFFGETALFKFRRGRPPDSKHSALINYLDLFDDYEHADQRLCWIPYAELLVDLWDDPSLLISARVRADQASCFGDGRQAFPADALRRAGMDPYKIDYLREGVIVEEAIDRTYGRGRYEVEETLADALVDVTWLDSVSGYVPPGRAEAFRSLTRYAAPANLRVISRYS